MYSKKKKMTYKDRKKEKKTSYKDIFVFIHDCNNRIESSVDNRLSPAAQHIVFRSFQGH